MKGHIEVPREVSYITKTLEESGYEAFLVGGCVRDILRGTAPKDWDITTNALPQALEEIFPHTHYNNDYGTVRVVQEDSTDESLKVIEVTTYRLDAEYSDGRRPDTVTFSTNILDDLKRRDFTINALAARVSHETPPSVIYETIIDPYGGILDLHTRLIKAVGVPQERFNEDGLRILRAVRLAAELRFELDPRTKEALRECRSMLNNVARERIHDEFRKMILSEGAEQAVRTLEELTLLELIIPELREGIGIDQNQAHSYTVWDHLLKSLGAAVDRNWSLELRLAALFHDIGKPATRKFSHEKRDWTFHGHEVVGSRVTEQILKRLKFPTRIVEKVTLLVRWHMFFSDPEAITLSAVRRMINNVGEENIWDLVRVRIADRIGTGRPKEEPYRLRKYKSMIEEALRDPISVAMLKINGTDIIECTETKPGPHIGLILHALLEEVLDDPTQNTSAYLKGRARELSMLPFNELREKGLEGKDKKNAQEQEEINKLRKKHSVS